MGELIAHFREVGTTIQPRMKVLDSSRELLASTSRNGSRNHERPSALDLPKIDAGAKVATAFKNEGSWQRSSCDTFLSPYRR